MARWSVFSLAAVVAAFAALTTTQAYAAGPSPQRAPATTTAPAPDPAPSAQSHPQTTTSPATHVSPTSPSRPPAVAPSQQPAVSTPAPSVSVAPHRARRVVAAKVVHHRAHKARTRHRRAPAARHRPAPVHHSRPAAHPAAAVVPVHVAARATQSHNNGVTLLVGALVLLVLVAASLGLLRVANRLGREIMGSAA
jgi:hypothetical protein